MLNRQPFRIQPQGSPSDYKTYQMRRASDALIVQACKEAGCEKWRRGWESHINEASQLGRAQADYIRRSSGRTFTEKHSDLTGLTVFRFEPGQRCFAEHKTQPMLYVVRGGDWRKQTSPARVHTNGDDWVDDFAEHQARLAEQHERG
jgi:hypothetical protein